MAVKLFLNTFYTVGIILCLIVAYQYGIVQHHYPYIISAALIIAIFVYLKVRILKEIKKTQKP
jgi:Family of unknown function (DUF6358)